MKSFQVQCWGGGRWREPNPWPKCVATVECQEPPAATPAGSRNSVLDDHLIFDLLLIPYVGSSFKTQMPQNDLINRLTLDLDHPMVPDPGSGLGT